MKYTTIADFGEYSVVQPIDTEYYIERSVARQRRRKEKRKKEIELFWSAFVAGIISIGVPILFIAAWIAFGY